MLLPNKTIYLAGKGMKSNKFTKNRLNLIFLLEDNKKYYKIIK